jgi:hypothetical protein
VSRKVAQYLLQSSRWVEIDGWGCHRVRSAQWMSRIALLESGDTAVDNIGKFVSGRRCEFGDSKLGDRFLNSASVHVAQAVTVPFGQSEMGQTRREHTLLQRRKHFKTCQCV